MFRTFLLLLILLISWNQPLVSMKLVGCVVVQDPSPALKLCIAFSRKLFDHMYQEPQNVPILDPVITCLWIYPKEIISLMQRGVNCRFIENSQDWKQHQVPKWENCGANYVPCCPEKLLLHARLGQFPLSVPFHDPHVFISFVALLWLIKYLCNYLATSNTKPCLCCFLQCIPNTYDSFWHVVAAR